MRAVGLPSLKGPITEEHLLAFFRLVSYLLAGAVFLLADQDMSLAMRALLVLLLGVEGWAVQSGYQLWQRSGYALGAIVALEAVGVLFLVSMTGGIGSPFIWYALNPALLAATGLSPGYCWLTLGLSLGGSVAAYRVLFGHQATPWLYIVEHNLSLILFFAMILLAVQLFSAFVRALKQRNQELESQRRELRVLNGRLAAESERARGLVQEMMALYQVIEAASQRTTPAELGETFATYARRLTGSPSAFFAPPDASPRRAVRSGGPLPRLDEALVVPLDAGSARLELEQGEVLVARIGPADLEHGRIGVLRPPELPDPIRQLTFLAELADVTFERLRLEALHEEAQILEEHERIAAEMHDRVAQRLFSLTYALHAVRRRWPELPTDLIAHLATLEGSAGETLREIRTVIRDLAGEPGGPQDVAATLASYCQRLQELHGVPVRLTCEGDLGRLPPAFQQALVRTVAEAGSNALHHGHASGIDVAVRGGDGVVRLEVRDDGDGFDLDGAPPSGEHFGLRGMRALADQLGGSLELESERGLGTTVRLRLPVASPRGSARPPGAAAGAVVKVLERRANGERGVRA